MSLSVSDALIIVAIVLIVTLVMFSVMFGSKHVDNTKAVVTALSVAGLGIFLMLTFMASECLFFFAYLLLILLVVLSISYCGLNGDRCVDFGFCTLLVIFIVVLALTRFLSCNHEECVDETST